MKIKTNILFCMSFVLFFSNCIHSQEEEPPHFDEQELLALTQEFQGTFDDEGVELLHKSNLDESIHSFLEVYHEIYSDLSNDPENVVLKSQVVLFNTNLGELERNLSVLLKSSGGTEVDPEVLDNILNSLQSLQEQVDASGSVSQPNKINFVRSVKIIGITVVAFAAVMALWGVYKLFKPSKEESQFADALERVEVGMDGFAVGLGEVVEASQRSEADTAKLLKVSKKTAVVFDKLGPVVNRHDNEIRVLQETTDGLDSTLASAAIAAEGLASAAEGLASALGGQSNIPRESFVEPQTAEQPDPVDDAVDVTMEDYEEGLGQEKASEEVENRLGAAAAILARKTPAPEIFEVFDREQETPAPAPVRRRWWQRLGCFNMNVQD